MEFEDLKRLALEENDSEAQYQLGMMYYSDPFNSIVFCFKNVNPDIKEQLDQKMLELDPDLDIQKTTNYEEAFKWLQMAANQGHTEAQFCLADIYLKTTKELHDLPLSLYWYEKAATKGHKISQYRLGWIYIYGEQIISSWEAEAIQFQQMMYNSHIQKDIPINIDPACQFISRNELIKVQDFEKGIHWMRCSANQDYISALYAMGEVYSDDELTKVNFIEARSWYQKAAEKNHAISQNKLGLIYWNGSGVTKNVFLAAKWFQKAAELGDSDGQNNTGYMYYTGKGVQKNYKMAKIWFEKAAKQLNVESCNFLGTMFQNGEGVEKDYAVSLRWYQKAAEFGHPQACYHVGKAHLDGVLIPKNYHSALEWFEKSSTTAAFVEIYHMYETKKISKDRALSLFEKRASKLNERGKTIFSEAAYFAAIIYLEPYYMDVPNQSDLYFIENIKKGIRWLQMSVESEAVYPMSYFLLAELSYLGELIKKNDDLFMMFSYGFYVSCGISLEGLDKELYQEYFDKRQSICEDSLVVSTSMSNLVQKVWERHQMITIENRNNNLYKPNFIN